MKKKLVIAFVSGLMALGVTTVAVSHEVTAKSDANQDKYISCPTCGGGSVIKIGGGT